MSIITLTTDYGLKDHFVAVVKGAIYSELPDAKVIDISHLITPFNISEAAYVVGNSYRYFPEGSIHIIGIDTEETVEKKHIVAKVNNHYFVCADNGVLSLIIQDTRPEMIVELDFDRFTERSIFPTKDVFVRTACHIARQGQINVLGRKIESIKQLSVLQPSIKDDNTILGSVIYIDNYGNVITNIKKDFFQQVGKGADFEIILPYRNKFNKLYKRYSDIAEGKDDSEAHGEAMVLFNSSNFLEISIYKSNLDTVGGASTLLGLQYRDTITVNFSK